MSVQITFLARGMPATLRKNARLTFVRRLAMMQDVVCRSNRLLRPTNAHVAWSGANVFLERFEVRTKGYVQIANADRPG